MSNLVLLRVLVASVLLPGLMLPAAAQTVVGGGAQPSVEVNLDVLNSLGPPPTLPDRLRGRLRLHPPASAAKATRHDTGKAAVHRAKRKTAKWKTRKHTRKHKLLAAKHRRTKTAAAAKARAVPAKLQAAKHESVAAPHAAAPLTLAPAAKPEESAAAPAPSRPATAVMPAAASASTIPTVAMSPAAMTVMSTPLTLAPEPTVTPAAAPAVTSTPRDLATRVLFAAGTSDIPETAKRDLKAVARRLAADEQTRLQLKAYAAGGAGEANRARRLSLSRALAVRTYLMEQGVRSTRMDVRALGNRLDGSDPPDRVDIMMLDH